MKKELFFLSLIVLFGSCAKVEDFPSDKMAGVQQDKATYFVTEGQAIKNVTDFLSGFGPISIVEPIAQCSTFQAIDQ